MSIPIAMRPKVIPTGIDTIQNIIFIHIGQACGVSLAGIFITITMTLLSIPIPIAPISITVIINYETGFRVMFGPVNSSASVAHLSRRR